jgi:hypothetical protein
MLRPLFSSVLFLSLFLSIMAAGQSAIRAGIVSSYSDPDPSPNLSLSCFGQSSADGAFLITKFSSNGCAQGNRLATEPNQRPVCVAGTIDLPEAPSTSLGDSSSGDAREVSESHFVSPTLELEKNAGKGGRTLDRHFILLNTLSAVALVADLETTVRGVEGQAKGAELNPLFGSHPTRARLYGIAVPLNIFSLYVSYHYKKIEPRGSIWKLGPGVSIGVHTAAAINNLIATHRSESSGSRGTP